MRLLDNGNGNHGVHQTRPEDGHEDQSQQQAGKGQNHIHDPHNEGIHPTTEKSGHKAEYDPDNQGN